MLVVVMRVIDLGLAKEKNCILILQDQDYCISEVTTL